MKALLILIMLFLGWNLTAQVQSILTTNYYSLATTGDTLIGKVYVGEDVVWRYECRWIGLTGTLDGTLQLMGSALPDSIRTDARYVDFGLTDITLSSAAGNSAFQGDYLSPGWVAVLFDKNNITGGYLQLIWIYKQKY
jgi:hypothetical protein